MTDGVVLNSKQIVPMKSFQAPEVIIHGHAVILEMDGVEIHVVIAIAANAWIFVE